MRLPARLCLAALLAVASGGGQARAGERVAIENFQFVPATLKVHRGDVVVWKNADFVAHNVTAQSGAFHSGDIAPNGSWKYTAARKGSFDYTCSLHPTMKGTLVVE